MPSLVSPRVPSHHLAPSKPLILEELYKNYLTPTSSSLPHAYIWPETDRASTMSEDFKSSTATDIPVVNMGDDDHTLRTKIASACEFWGVFYLTNHGMSTELLESVTQKGLELFSLPLSSKLRALRKEGSFDGFGKALIGKFFENIMWSEGFTMMGHPTSSISETTSKLCPNGDNNFRDVFEEYDNAARTVIARLMRHILMGLGVGVDGMEYDVERETQSALQLNYYAPCPQAHMTMGLPAHTDSTFLTLLHQGLVPGLEVQRPGLPWTPVPPLGPASLVIHVGDMLQVLSNGKYRSIVHRAIANRREERFSIACLSFPPSSVTISPLKDLIDIPKNQKPLYKPLTWKDYVNAKSKYFMGALDHFKYEQA